MKFLILILVITPTLLFCQTWEKIYGGDGIDVGYSVQQTTDGGYIITGYTYSVETGSYDVYLIKTDEYGDTLWTKTYGGGDWDMGLSVQQSSDNGYIITGIYTNLSIQKTYLIKTNANGDTIWTKTFGNGSYNFGYSVQQTTDGGYVITGQSLDDVSLIKTDENGDTLWTRTYGVEYTDKGYSVEQTTDGGYIISGFTDLYGYYPTIAYLIKTDETGDTIWTKTYGIEYTEGHSVQQTTDGGYIITGMGIIIGGPYSCIYLIKTDLNGDTLWTKKYSGIDDIGRSYSVQQTTDGGYIVTGDIAYESETKVCLIKTNEHGDELWTRTFGNEVNNTGYSVQQTIDGGFIIAGESLWNVYLIKTDENGIITSTIEILIPNPNRKLIKTIDLSGKDLFGPAKNQPFIEIYDDGTSKKKMIIE